VSPPISANPKEEKHFPQSIECHEIKTYASRRKGMPFEVEAKLKAKVLNSPGSLLFPSCLKLILICGVNVFSFRKQREV
jgi:hypothetical protein